jgi:hypothetical protein
LDSHRSVSLGWTGDEPQWQAHHLSDRGGTEGLFLASQRGGLGGGRGNSPRKASFPTRRRGGGCCLAARREVHIVVRFARKEGNGATVCGLSRGPHATRCSAGRNQRGRTLMRTAPCWIPHMGSGSVLSMKTLVQFPDVFLLSPQFLHLAFSLSNKVNKCQ